MKRDKPINTTIFAALALMGSSMMPVYAAEYQDYSAEYDGLGVEREAECEVIYKESYEFSEEIPKYPALTVTNSGYEGFYDGKAHGIKVESMIEGVKITYSQDGKTYSPQNPVYTNAGTYTTYYKVEKEGYNTASGSGTVTIKKAPISYSVSGYDGPNDGKIHGINISVNTNECKITYSTDGVNYTEQEPAFKESGSYTVYYKITGDNYETVTGSSRVDIGQGSGESGTTKGSLTVTAYGYEGIYDGKPHEIKVESMTEGAKITYSEDGKIYNEQKPAYTNAGTYTTYYKVEKEGCNTVFGSGIITIKKAPISYSVIGYNGTDDGRTHGINISVNTDGCKITYSTDGVNYTEQEPTFKEPGSYVVHYKITGDNFETVTGSSKVEIGQGSKESDTAKGNLTVTTYRYEGIYDGKPHGIIVSCLTEGAKITYSEDGKTYSSQKPVYTNAGTYTTYYKVEKEGYNTVFGSGIVTIKKAPISYSVIGYNGTDDGRTHGIDISVNTNGCKITYSTDGVNYTDKEPTFKEPGSYVVHYKITGDNFETVTGSSRVEIRQKNVADNSGAFNMFSGNNTSVDSQNNSFLTSNATQNNNTQLNNTSNSPSTNNVSNSNTESSTSNVRTGDNAPIALFGAAIMLSVIGMFKEVKIKLRKK